MTCASKNEKNVQTYSLTLNFEAFTSSWQVDVGCFSKTMTFSYWHYLLLFLN